MNAQEVANKLATRIAELVLENAILKTNVEQLESELFNLQSVKEGEEINE